MVIAVLTDMGIFDYLANTCACERLASLRIAEELAYLIIREKGISLLHNNDASIPFDHAGFAFTSCFSHAPSLTYI